MQKDRKDRTCQVPSMTRGATIFSRRIASRRHRGNPSIKRVLKSRLEALLQLQARSFASVLHNINHILPATGRDKNISFTVLVTDELLIALWTKTLWSCRRGL
jgi:hypothetical protein